MEKLKIHFQPLLRMLKNFLDYRRYVFKYSKGAFAVKTIPLLIGLVSLILDGIPGLDTPVLLIITVVSWLWGFGKMAYDLADTYDERFVRQESIEGIYDDVRAPTHPVEWQGESFPWERIFIEIRNEYGAVVETSAIYKNEGLDRWLRDENAMRRVTIAEDAADEKRLAQKIKSRFGNLYRPFLLYNYRVSQFNGRQFTNEPKWGISARFGPGESECVRVKAACYYDTYLTNIIPGSRLVLTRTGETQHEIGDADGALLPYDLDADSGVKYLKELDEFTASDELGVTTLGLLKKGRPTIRLWRQNYQAQSSRGQLVATGSGSADWADCSRFLGKEQGFSKAVIRGMERELYEESVGKREISREDFLAQTHTRILGYFRWLKKGGKSEFVGLSKIGVHGIDELLSAEESEVSQKDRKDVPSYDIRTLKGSLRELVYPDPERSEVYISKHCSVSCSAAILALGDLCAQVCETCPHRAECESDPDFICGQDPCKALFPSAE